MISDKEKLWKLFSDTLISAELNPEDYRKYFEEEYETLKAEEPISRERIVRALAKFAVQSKPEHPIPPSIPAMHEVLQIREEMDKAKQKVDLRDRASIEQYTQRLKELKRREEKVWSDLELKRSEIKAKALRENGRNVISITCLKCGKPLKYNIEFERGLCMDCYNQL